MKTSMLLIALIFVTGCSNTPEDPCTMYDQLDSQLLKIIEQVKEKHAKDVDFLAAFQMEQVYWVQYTNRRLRSIYPKNWDTYYRKNYGQEVFNSCKCIEMVRMAKRRIEDLKMYLEGAPPDQKDCPSMLISN